MRVLFLCPPSRAFGEINTLIPLAQQVRATGGEVRFLTSPLASSIAQTHFPQRVFKLTPYRDRNQVMLWRIIKKFRPDVVVFADFYEVLRPLRRSDCPLVDARFFEIAASLPCALVFVDFIAHADTLRD